MENSRMEIKVGLFVLVALVLLAALVIEFSKGVSPFRGTYELRLHASNVGGLKKNAAVLLAGVPVGNVSTIQIAPDGKSVTILLQIYDGYKIYPDAHFVIEESGFLGDHYVAVIPTADQGSPLTNGASVNCEAPFNLQEVARSAAGFIQQIDQTAKKLDASMTELQRVVLNERTLTNFSVAVENMRLVSEQALGTVGDINTLIATNGAQVNLAVSNVVSFSQELTHLANSTDAVVTNNAEEISSVIKNIDSSAQVLKRLMNDLQSGRGLAGTLLQNEQLATNVQTIANNLSITSSNLNRLGLWGILWAHKPPATNAAPPTLLSPRAAGQQ